MTWPILVYFLLSTLVRRGAGPQALCSAWGSLCDEAARRARARVVRRPEAAQGFHGFVRGRPPRHPYEEGQRVQGWAERGFQAQRRREKVRGLRLKRRRCY